MSKKYYVKLDITNLIEQYKKDKKEIDVGVFWSNVYCAEYDGYAHNVKTLQQRVTFDIDDVECEE